MFIPFGLHLTDEATEQELLQRSEDSWVDTVADDVTYATAVRTIVDILGATIISEHIIEVDITVVEKTGHDWFDFDTVQSTTHPADRYYGMWRHVTVDPITESELVCSDCFVVKARNGACFCESSIEATLSHYYEMCLCHTESLYCSAHYYAFNN